MNCNHKLPDDSEFCQYCGNKIEVNTSEEVVITPTDIAKENDSDVSVSHVSEEISNPFKDVDVENMTSKDALNLILGFHAKQTVKDIEANAKNQCNYENDPDFGLVPEKPIYTLGTKLIDGEREFLNSLCTSDGEKIKWERRGSVSAEGVNGMIDIYDIYMQSGQLYKTIYINMYGAKRSTKAPVGFILNNETSSEPTKKKKRKKIKTKYCSRCGSVIDRQTKICTGCGKKFFKIRVNKFSVAIIILSTVIVALASLNIFQYSEVQDLKKEMEILETQISSKEKSLEGFKKTNDDLRKKNQENSSELRFFRNYAEIVGDDGTGVYHKYGCTWLDTSDGLWIFNSENAKYQGYKKCPHCH